MKIEICVPSSATTKERGDLLETLSREMLEIQNFKVEEEVKKTGMELDLLCKHNVADRTIYVECKAYRDGKIDAPIIRQLMGTIVLQGYSEGWLISTSELGKEAKGIEDELASKGLAGKLVIYTPRKIIDSLLASKIINPPPQVQLIQYLPEENIGEWSLLITPYGKFWAVAILEGGMPSKVVCYHAKSLSLVDDQALLDNIASTDSNLSKLDFSKIILFTKKEKKLSLEESLIEVVEVQKGDDWNDYRPARPEDFVGRTKDINDIFDFFKKIKEKETTRRCFAITGNSGLGKSSLIIKLLEKAENRHQKHKVYICAVDVRAAKSSEYIYAALLKTLKNAQKKGFGDPEINILITNASHPLDSESITEYLESVDKANQRIVLVFDQFEELFSKPDLSDLFTNTSNMLMDATSLQFNFCIGFAWKTDSTTHTENPAYFFWHKLSEYRMVRKLSPFSDRESHTVISKFEDVIGQKLDGDLKHNLTVSSQGYPWLLKKLCIHLYDKLEQGAKQEDLLENKLDIASLFSDDLSELSISEQKALRFVATKAPVDLIETIEICTDEIVQSLLHKRLIVKSGNRLNLYWDIFREFVLTGNVPIIALRYLPSHDFSTIWNVVKYLSKSPVTIHSLQEKTNFSEGTIQNVGTDILLFGLATRENSQYVLSEDLLEDGNTQENLLNIIREKFKKHIITLHLKDLPSGTFLTITSIIDLMKETYSENKYADKTWRLYAIRLIRWLELTGFLQPTTEPNTWIYRDLGSSKTSVMNRRRTSNFFVPRISPQLFISIYSEIVGKSLQQLPNDSKTNKTVEILRKFELVDNDRVMEIDDFDSILYAKASSEFSIQAILEIKDLYSTDKLSGQNLGILLKEKYDLKWTDVTTQHSGNKLNSWAKWIKAYEVKNE